jgi:uncharacterized protein (PEP-CTERM system associated)
LSRDDSQPARLKHVVVAGLTLAVIGGPNSSHAQTWRLTPSIAYESTLTDNVNLTPNDQRKADWINQFTPSLRFFEQGGHSRFAGNVSLPILLYARTPENNYVAPTVDISGNAELIDRFLFIDASANVSQEYQTPFGARPNNLANATNNRYTAQSYTLSPYLRGLLANNLDYEIRDSNIWSVGNGVGTTSGDAYDNFFTSHLTRQPTPLGWSLSYDRTALQFQDQPSETLQIARANALYQADQAVELSATVGYEDNDLQFTNERGVTYGVGGTWHPTDRTTVEAKWEHRFFGASYNVLFDHRTPLSVWALRASRDITNYPTQLAALPAGSNVASFLNSLFLSKVPDPTQRQSLIDQIIRARGLPTTLAGPVTLLSQQITLVEQATATFGILGARNSIFLNVYHNRQEPIDRTEFSEINGLLVSVNNNTQNGVGVVWSHQLAGDMTLATSADWSRSVDNVEPHVSTRLGTIRTVLSTSLSPYTTVYASARLQDSRSTAFGSYREIAVVVGASYFFH